MNKIKKFQNFTSDDLKPNFVDVTQKIVTDTNYQYCFFENGTYRAILVPSDGRNVDHDDDGLWYFTGRWQIFKDTNFYLLTFDEHDEGEPELSYPFLYLEVKCFKYDGEEYFATGSIFQTYEQDNEDEDDYSRPIKPILNNGVEFFEPATIQNLV